jgi:hypothetical protein
MTFLMDELKSKYTLVQRIVYDIRKHWLVTVLAIGSFWLLNQLDPVLELTLLTISTVARLSIGLVIAELYWKIRFPKVSLQSAMLADNTSAVAVYIGIVIASALV